MIWAEAYNHLNTGAALGVTSSGAGQVVDVDVNDSIDSDGLPSSTIRIARDHPDRDALATMGNTLRIMSNESGSTVELVKVEVKDVEDVFLGGPEITTIKGPRIDCQFRDALLNPWQRNLDLEPQPTDSRTWNFASPDRPMADFVHQFVEQAEPYPFRWQDPYVQGVWCLPQADPQPAGRMFAVRDFTISEELQVVFPFASTSSVVGVWLQGEQIGRKPIEVRNIYTPEPRDTYRKAYVLHPGTYRYGFEVYHDGQGPAAVWASAWTTKGSSLGEPIFITGEPGHGPHTGTWYVLRDPVERPGVELGRIVRHVVEDAQWLGGLAGWSLGFSDTHDTDSAVFPVVEYQRSVDDHVWDLIKEFERLWIQTRVRPGAGKILDAFVRPFGDHNNFTIADADWLRKVRRTSI